MNGQSRWAALLCGALLAGALGSPAARAQNAPPSETPEKPTTDQQKAEAPPAVATEVPKKKSNLEDPPLHRWGGWTISLAAWNPSMVGDQVRVGLVVPQDGTALQPLYLEANATIRESWIVSYHLPKGMGSIVMHYDSMNFTDNHDYFSPGQFVYDETELFTPFRGAFDDGLSDGIRAKALLKTREFRLEYSDVAYESKRAKVTWGAGVRNADHNENIEIRYLALVPNIPPVIPPIITPAPDPAQWKPQPDVVHLQSDYSGTGAGASLDVEFKLHPRFSIVSGLSLGLLRGNARSFSKSQSSFYFSAGTAGPPATPPHYVSGQELIDTLTNGTPEEILAITQQNVVLSYYAPKTSLMGQTYDIYIGAQSPVYKGLRVFAMFRDMYYANVGQIATFDANGDLRNESKSVGYEGYLVGLSWRF